MNLAYHAFNISAPATLNKCSRTLSDAQPQRCPGRAEESDPQCTLTLCRAAQQAHQDRYTLFGQELHPDAGQHVGGDEEAGVVLVACSRGARSMPPSHGTCTPALGPSMQWELGLGGGPGDPRDTLPPHLFQLAFPPILLLPALPHHTTHQHVTSRHLISQNRCEDVSPRSFLQFFWLLAPSVPKGLFL